MTRSHLYCCSGPVLLGLILIGSTSAQTFNATASRGDSPGTSGNGTNPQGLVEVDYRVFPLSNPEMSNSSVNAVPEYDPSLNCICVGFYLCDSQGFVDTTGQNVIDIRIDNSEDVWNVRQCPDVTMQCCKLPPGVTAPPRPQTTPTPAPTSTPRGATCGVRQSSVVDSLLRIKDGGETEFGEFPWMLALISMPVLPGGGTLNVFVCGASLIHPKVAVTAAHCITTARKVYPNVNFKIRAGEWDTNSTDELFPHQDRDVTQVILRDGFNKGSLVNDIALLVLSEPLEMADNVGTICLPEDKEQFVGANCVATGWGKEAFDTKSPFQTILRMVNLQVTLSSQCQEDLRKTKLGPRFKLNPSFLCAAGKSGEDTCKGDGGGPLVCPSRLNPDHYVQVGIVSWGIGCGNGTPAVYTDVAFQRSWIDEKLRLANLSGSSG